MLISRRPFNAFSEPCPTLVKCLSNSLTGPYKIGLIKISAFPMALVYAFFVLFLVKLSLLEASFDSVAVQMQPWIDVSWVPLCGFHTS